MIKITKKNESGLMAKFRLATQVGFIFFGLFATMASGSETELFFLKPDSINPSTVLSAPPAPGSERDVHDMREVLRRQEEVRTLKICTRTKAVGDPATTLERVFGQILSADEITKWSPFFLRIQNDQRVIRALVKDVFKRNRPSITNPEVKPCLKILATPSYPSGHSTMAHVSAAVFSLLDPSREAAFDAIALQISEDRVNVGVHYPSDIDAGRRLAEAIVAEFQKNPDFQDEIKALKK